ncbi:glycosyltransferase family 2 protein [Xylariaceae sp. FL0594]|nr:glycosyltransferase family 2 protein [Xylariaceae sp. FL0594]
MSLPERPGSLTPSYEQRNAYRQSPARRNRPHDVETGNYYPVASPPSRQHQRVASGNSFPETIRNPDIPDRQPLSPSPSPMPQQAHGAGGPTRKRSLIRPERNRIDKDHPNYHYRKHAAQMETYPSTTGNEPLFEDLEDSTKLSAERSLGATSDSSAPREPRERSDPLEKPKGRSRASRRRRSSGHHKSSKLAKEQRAKPKEVIRPPSIWNVYCAVITFWCPDFVLSWFGFKSKAQRRAWREKMGLISIILYLMTFVGFLTFGFTQVVCGSPGIRLHVNEVGTGYMIFHGKAYDLTKSRHPPADGIPLRPDGGFPNILYDVPDMAYGGRDGSFMFQNVNGKCKDLITATDKSTIPTNAKGDLAWYFPCTTFAQDGSSKPNYTYPYYNGWSCHTTREARDTFYLDIHPTGDVFYTWDDLKNDTRNLIVYSGQVLDLDLLQWFDEEQVNIPDRFKELRDRNSAANAAVRGRDVTRAFQKAEDKHMAQCFEEIIKVGTVDTETVGCIASQVVLYVSLALILSIVGAKFVLAIVFQWFISRKYGASKTSQTADKKRRNQQIEDWTQDIYRAPPRMPGDINSSYGGSDRNSKRTSVFLPTTSRFSTVYGPGSERSSRRPQVTTMSSQASTGPLLHPGSMYKQANDSRVSMLRPDGYHPSPSPLDGYGPAGFIHEAVVPQPPSDYQPFGFPLIHSICLVTAYSEGELGLRTTLDSLAMTDYPNSHKVILVICDGQIKGKGETMSTPDICLGMMKDHTVDPREVTAFSYVAVASGSKRHNMAKVYAGFYDYGADSTIPVEKQQRVPMLLISKCGTPDEATKAKPGNRGKRDSQIILMSFLQKVMFDERMSELEYEMFNGLWKVTGIPPDYYEAVLMVDADTKVFPDSLTHMLCAMVRDPEIMGLCGETKIANKKDSWVTAIQVFEYFISHHQAKSFESVFGGVTCLPGCFCMYRIKAPKAANTWVPILANPDIVEHYSENVVETLHEKNLLLLGEDRYLTTLMLRTFPKRKQVFVPQAVCKTTVPDEFMVLLSQRRRWINSTIHNLMELILVRDLCGTFCFSMQFVVFIDLVGTLVLPAAIAFTIYVVVISIVGPAVQIIPLVLLALILGLPAVLIVVTAHSWTYVGWLFIYLLSLPIWNFVLPAYAFWKFDDFSWGETRKTAGEKTKKAGIEYEGEFDSSKIKMRRWCDFERERRMRDNNFWGSRESVVGGSGGGGGGNNWSRGPTGPPPHPYDEYYSDV